VVKSSDQILWTWPTSALEATNSKLQGHVSQHQSQDHLRPLLRKPRAEDQSTWRSKGGWKMEWKNLRENIWFSNVFFGMNFNYGFVYWPYFAGKYSYSNLNWLGSYFMIELRIQDDYVSYEMTNEQPVCGWSTSPSWQFLVQLGICYIIASAWMVSKHD